MGVGLANQLMAPAGQATSGVDWSQAASVFSALFLSPLMGFVASAALLLVMKFLIRKPELYEAPKTPAAAAAVDPRPPDPHLHRRLLRPWRQ